ncbi:hypothetical protein MXD81_09595, partial [Microbacteriaceae bacterium K1510]|nr:hypothetical protein [Microbacteriaceae bacterium K1510]
EKGESSWQPVEKFPDWQSYSDLVYSRAAIMLWELRTVWGEKKVNSVLGQYVNAHRFSIASGKDLIQAFSQASGADATAYFEYWLHLDESQLAKAMAWLEKLKNK